jgi:type IV pilus assembly protein PilC
MDRAALHIPLTGKLSRISGTADFARGLGTMLHSGVWLIDALQTMEKLLGNRYLGLCVANAREQVAQGSSLAGPLLESNAFMPILPRMIAVGESSGRVDYILEEMARYHEDLLARAIKRMVGIIGPLMTILIGGLIGFVYAAFLTAMFAAAGGSPK